MAGILLDVCTVGLIVLMFFVGKKKGFIRSVFAFLGTAVSAILAYWTCGPAGDFLYKTLARGNVINAITDVLEKSGATVEGIVSSLTSALSVLGSETGLASEVESALSGLSGQSNEVIAQNLADTVVADALAPMMRAVCFVVLFFLFLIVIRVVGSLVSKGIHALPVIGAIDCWMGGLVGIAEGLLLVIVLAFVISMIPAFIGAPVITQAEIDGTYLFRFFYNLVRL